MRGSFIPTKFTARWAAALVTVLACLNYLVGIDEPAGTVWDESYYLTSTQRYEERNAQFASHPPLGLMLIAAGDAVLKPNRALDTSELHRAKKIEGEKLGEQFSFVGVRLTSALFAVAGAVVFFALMLVLTQSVIGATLLTNLYVFENAFIAQFRAAQLDSFQIFFSLCALLCWAASVRRAPRRSLALDFALGLSCGLAAMVKLNGAVLSLLGFMLLIWRVLPIARRADGGDGNNGNAYSGASLALTTLRDAAVMMLGGVTAVAAVMTVYVAISDHPPDPYSVAGSSDNRFITQVFRDYLDHKRPISPAVVLDASADYARFISSDFAGMARSDPNASTALQWPLHRKTINYRWDSEDDITSYVQLCGNLFSWLLALIAPVAAAGLLLLQLVRPRQTVRPVETALLIMLTVQYLVFMGIHAWLGTQRVMYLYHYFIALILAFCLIPLAWGAAAARWRTVRELVEPVIAFATVLLLASFLFYSPLSFHRPLTHAQCERRNFFQHVVDCRP